MRLRLATILALSAASLLLAAPLAGQGTGAGASQPAAADPNEDADARWRRLQAESAARVEAERNSGDTILNSAAWVSARVSAS
jgi:hypothetical protein